MAETMWDGGLIRFPNQVNCIFEMPPRWPSARNWWEVEGTKGLLGPGVGAVDGAPGYHETLVIDHPETLDQLFEAGSVPRSHQYPIEWVYGERDGQGMLECIRVNTDSPVVWENSYARYGIFDDDAVFKATYLESMYRAVVENRPLVYGADNTRRDMELWIAIRESAWRGNVWVGLPLAEVTSVEEAIHEEFRRRYGCVPLGDLDR